jgi:hypothetical protein
MRSKGHFPPRGGRTRHCASTPGGRSWFYNEYIREGGFTHVAPRTFWQNLSDGFFFDDNHFSNNLFGHPYHGSLYFNSARSNGLNYWEAMPFALMGSFLWECCGESRLSTTGSLPASEE